VADQNAAQQPKSAPEPKAQSALEGLSSYLRDPERELDRLVYERVRLGILSSLAVNEPLTFSDLKRLLKTSDGNLSVHARKLEDAGFLSCVKRFEGRTPRTEYRLTSTGRRALERYLLHMEAILRAARG